MHILSSCVEQYRTSFAVIWRYSDGRAPEMTLDKKAFYPTLYIQVCPSMGAKEWFPTDELSEKKNWKDVFYYWTFLY